MQYDQFHWDDDKEIINVRKHGISFDEASSVFSDENAIIIFDEEHSLFEDRFIIIGFSVKARLLVVCHCYKESETIIRIISARKANSAESGLYGGAL
jgi:uncharacterized DUF497 family protein